MSKYPFPILLTCGLGLLLLLFVQIGYEATWQLWNIPTLSPHFADLRSITGGAESFAQGFDPLYENPSDPWDRPMNYPRIWQALFLLEIDQSDTTVLGIVMVTAFISGVLLIFWRNNLNEAIITTFCLFSPAVLFAVERGNNDLFVFFVLALMLHLFEQAPIVAYLLFNLAVVLKLFPIFGFLLFFSQKRSQFWRAAAFILPTVLLYLAFTRDDLIAIQQATQRGTEYAYGINVFGMYVGRVFGSVQLTMLLRIFLIVIVLGYSISLRRYHAQRDVAFAKTRHTAPFLLGSGIYIGTFLLGNNFDYRLIFLLFTLPQLVRWCGEQQHSRIAVGSLFCIIISLWSPVLLQPLRTSHWGNHIGFAVDEVLNWGVLFTLLYFVTNYGIQHRRAIA